MVSEMAKTSFVDFGAHTYTHIDATKINDNNFDKEIHQANDLIEKYTGKQVEDFCFPYGYYNKKITYALCDKKIYKRIYTSDNIKLTVCNGCEIIGRIGISTEYDVKTFQKKVNGLYNIMYYYLGIRKGFPEIKDY